MIVPVQERTGWFQAQAGITLTAAHQAFLNTLQPQVEQVCWKVIGYNPAQATYTEFYPGPQAQRPPLNFGIDIGWDMVGNVAMPRSRTDLTEGAIVLKTLPVRSVGAVYENLAAWTGGDANGNWPAASLLPATAYRLDMEEEGLCKSGRLYRTVGGWPSTPRCVKVTYTAGWTQAEIDDTQADLKLAVLLGLMWWWGKAMRASNSTKAMGLTALQMAIRDFSVTLGDPNAMNANKGEWAFQVLGPDSMALLQAHVNMAKYLGN